MDETTKDDERDELFASAFAPAKPLPVRTPKVHSPLIQNPHSPIIQISRLQEISRATGLPQTYTARFPRSSEDVRLWHPTAIREVRIHAYETPDEQPKEHLDADLFRWQLIPREFTDELEKLPWEHVLGQGVLVRDGGGLTALMSIAEAATLHMQDNIHILQALLVAIDDSISAITQNRKHQIYQLKW